MSTPTRTRNLEKTRAEILSVAFLEIFRSGFQGVSINDIVSKTRMTKGAFFHHFPTKLELGYALVDEVLKPMVLDRWILPLADLENPLQGMLMQMQKHIGSSSVEQLRLGCPLNNLLQEMSPVDAVFAKKLQKVLKMWIDETEVLVRKAQENGFVRKDVKPRQVAEFIVMAHEGFYGMIKGLGGDKRVFDSLLDSLKIYFKSIQ